MIPLNELLERADVEVLSVADGLESAIEDLMRDLVSFGEPRRDVLDAILNVVTSRDVKTIVVQHKYFDDDYTDTYYEHYAKAFQPRPVVCKRLHFFAAPLSPDELFAIPKGVASSYLGYCCLRPTGNQYVSRTVIAPPFNGAGDNRFIPAYAKFQSQLLGQSLEVEGAPFIQQDANTFVCAGAALWTLGHYMHNRHGAPRYFPYQITKEIQRRYSPGQVRNGVTVEQIVMMLQSMKLNPHLEQAWNLRKLREEHPREVLDTVINELRDFIHVFVDAGLPPILAYVDRNGWGHAVTVVGHNIAKRDPVDKETVRSFGGALHNSFFVDEFYVMDDARGPYVSFPVKQVGGMRQSLEECDDIAVIAPRPNVAAIELADAFQEMSLLIGDWNNIIAMAAEQVAQPAEEGFEPEKYMLEFSLKNPIVLRPALLDSRAWKMQLLDDQVNNIPEWLKHEYQAMLLPRYIWVIEISDYHHTNHHRRSDRKIFGEVVLDAGANPHSPLDSLISFHAKGLIMDVSGGDAKFRILTEEWVPYSPVYRSI